MEIVNADEAVIVTVAYEGDGVSVRGPYQLGDVAACAEQWLCFGRISGQACRPYLPVREERDLIAPRRYYRVVAFSQLSRIAALSWNEPDVFCNTIRRQRGIWIGLSGKPESPPRT